MPRAADILLNSRPPGETDMNKTVSALPAAESCRRLNYEHAELAEIPESNGRYAVVVHGEAPCLNMHVSLSPFIYIRRPEYWGIEVVGCLPGGICLTAIKPFVLALDLDSITGTKGIEIIGANRTDRFEIPPA